MPKCGTRSGRCANDACRAPVTIVTTVLGNVWAYCRACTRFEIVKGENTDGRLPGWETDPQAAADFVWDDGGHLPLDTALSGGHR